MQENQERKFTEDYNLEDAQEAMASFEQGGLDREKPKIRLNEDGAEVAAREVAELHRMYALESPAGTHNEAGIPLPNKIEDEATKAKYLAKLIDNPSIKKPEDQMDDLLQRYNMN